MRVKINKKIDIIKIGKNPIVAIGLLNNGDVFLDIEFGVDISSCLKNDIQVITLNVYGQEMPSTFSSPILNDLSDGLRSAVIADSSEKSFITRIKTEYKVASINVDITKLISNDSIRAIKKDYNATFNVTKTNDSKFEIINNIDFVIDQPVEKNIDSVEEQSLESLRVGKDPALLRGSFPIVNPSSFIKRNLQGVKKNVFQSYRTSGNPVKYTVGSIDSRFSSCITRILLPRKSISSLPILYLEINLSNKKGSTISREKFNVYTHTLDIDLKVLEDKKRQDQVMKYARIVNSRHDAAQSPYVSLGSGFLKQKNTLEGQDARLSRILNGKYHTHSYFSKPISKTKKISVEHSSNIIPFSLLKVGYDVQIKVEATKTGIISIGVERRDATASEKFRKLFTQGLEPILVTENSTITFVDSDFLHNHVYEYRIFFIDNKSNTKSSSNTCLYHYAATNVMEPASLEITNLGRKIINDGDIPRLQISFDINAKLTDSGIEVAQQFLSLNGLSESILGIPELETSGYKKLLVYQIDRQNLRTGEIETFNTVYDTKFIDESASRSNLRTISPLNLLDSYRYFVRLGLRDPSALVSIQTSTKTSAAGKKSYDYRSYKFKINPKSGNLPSSLQLDSRASSSLTENFFNFFLGVEAYTTSLASDYAPKITGLSIRKTLIGFNSLNWSIIGDSTTIDHFRIYTAADGVEAFIGAAHPHVTDGSYFYEDYEMYNRLGEVIYRVVPVGLNFIELRGEASVKIVIQNNAPTFLR